MQTTGLLAQVLVAKCGDHLPLYRRTHLCSRGLGDPAIDARPWVGICDVRLQPLVDALRETLLQRDVVYADETPVRILSPGTGKTHRAYLWAYGTTPFVDLKAVVCPRIVPMTSRRCFRITGRPPLHDPQHLTSLGAFTGGGLRPFRSIASLLAIRRNPGISNARVDTKMIDSVILG
ncbi:IS66 family transposase [Burkholderia sp. BCC1630]|uniref:IS66 family transposase n=1 Tax=Burkholderia sp. BCC1630 TaxID=2676304 RepID=UPI001FC88E74|nr:IS66 family transposase [Burkholderia sp. BCC1630]